MNHNFACINLKKDGLIDNCLPLSDIIIVFLSSFIKKNLVEGQNYAFFEYMQGMENSMQITASQIHCLVNALMSHHKCKDTGPSWLR